MFTFTLATTGQVAPSRLRRSAAALVLILYALTGQFSRLCAAAPTLDHVYPVAVTAGTTTSITAVGKFAPWPAKVWTDVAGISFQAEKDSGKFSVAVEPDVPPGPHLIRLFNETGASAPRFLIVTAKPDGTETEPNDDYRKATTLEDLPTTISGRLNKSGDVDSYAVKLESGQTLIASLEAFVLASPFDGVLRLVDSRGLEMALNHDDGRTLDPFLTWTAKTAGTYVLQVFGFAHPATADVRFTGSDACVYRLHVSHGAQARYTLPLGLQRVKDSKRRVFGWNLGALSERELEVDGTAFPADATRAAWRHPEFENTLRLPLGDGPELIERGLNPRGNNGPVVKRISRTDPAAVDSDFASSTGASEEPGDGKAAEAVPAESSVPAPPYSITGCISKTGEEDRFGFSAVKDERLVLEIQSASLGFPLDAWVAIHDAAGKELTRNDDGPTADPVLEWSAPATGSYFAVVGSVLHRSGPDHLYRLSIQRAQPDFKGLIAESGFIIEPGKTIKIKATARRVHGFKSRLTASITGLPEGVTAAPVEMGETEKEIALELSASADAGPFSGPIGINFRDGNSDTVHPGIFELITTSLKNGVPQGFRELVIRSTDRFWLTVMRAAAAKPEAPVQAAKPPAPALYFPPATGKWEEVSAAKVGWDEEKLKAALDMAGKTRASGVVILHRGKVLAEKYWEVDQGARAGKKARDYGTLVRGHDAAGHVIEDVASVQKSVAAILVGLAQEKGLLQLADPVSQHLGVGWSKASPEQEKAITVRHLLTMTSGLKDDLAFEAAAGTRWRYNSTAYSRTVTVVAAAAKMTPNELTRKWLTGRIGMSDSQWVERPRTNSETAINPFGFATTARDLARFGLLILAEGRWSGETIIEDREFLRAALEPSQNLNPSYGFLWWLNGQAEVARGSGERVKGPLIPSAPPDLVAALGAVDRKLYVVPSLQLIVTRLGNSAGPSFQNDFWKLLMEAAPPPAPKE